MISTLIFTLNEESNLPHCLGSLGWCDDVIVVDSGSVDNTVEIAVAAGARVVSHPFAGFGDQRNWALDNVDIKHDWILVLDADEKVPVELAGELKGLAESSPEDVGAYRLRRRFYLWGKWLKYSSLYPTWVVRFIRKERVRYVNRGHGETQEVDGRIGECRNDLIDENHKGIEEWFERQNRYSTQDLEYLRGMLGKFLARELFSGDPLVRRKAMKALGMRLPFRGALYFLWAYFLKLGFLDGREGFYFCRMRAMYHVMMEIKGYGP